MRSMISKTIIDIFVTNWISRFRILTNQERQFKSGLFFALLKCLKPQRLCTNAFHTQTNEFVDV